MAKKRSRKIEFSVSFIRPPYATVEDCREYVTDAVVSMCGCYRPPGSLADNDPGDPMFDLDGDTVRVRRRNSV